MKIKREKLLKNLQNFVLGGNGVVIGSPGVGKTYLLKELRRTLKSEGIPHLLLPIDQLGDGSDETLRKELSYEGDLIDKLRSIPISDKKGVLLFDAFDAARNEQTRKRFLKLIRRANYELSESWHVTVTVRTYDAKKSQELLDLFGNRDDTDLPQHSNEGILCRHFIIPLLSEDEIRQVFDQIPYLESVYNDGSQEFKQLLANPFNLWLLEKILKNPQDVRALSQIYSEVQLLDLFWQRRIISVSNEVHRLFVLKRIVRRMVEERSLTVRQNDVYKDLELDKLAIQRAWDDLLSDEILAKVSLTGQRIAFSHNILFDYAISVLLIEDDPQQLEDFVLEDSSRPLFLRPSLSYFFTRLWYDAPESFWNTFWHILPSNRSVHLRLFARLIPTSVIANEVREIVDLTPLLEQIQNGEKIANEAMMQLLQSLRTLQIERDPLWSVFFDKVSVHLHRKFAWDLATLTSEMLERVTKSENMAVIDACGVVGRRLLAWIWQEKETSKDDWYNRLGSFWVVPLVAKTYGTNAEESRALLGKVLELTQEDNFPIDFLTWLIEDIDKIWPHDSEFVGLIYRAVFTHNENSNEKTHMAGIIVSMTSTRRQDYDMCQYQLIEHFPDFLRAAPLPATRAVIQSLNSFIIDTYTFRDTQEGMTVKETFNFRGKRAYSVEDIGFMWEGREYTNEPIEMADALFEFIAELAMSRNPLLDSLLDVFRDHVRAAFFWKRLLKTGAQFPEVFAPHLFELCIAKPIQISDVVFYELRTFLETAAAEFPTEQRLQIEKSILELPEEDRENREFLEERRNRLLAQIPRDLLITDAAKEIWKKMEQGDGVPEDRPLISVRPISPEPYTDEKWLQEQDIDTTTSENRKLQQFFGTLDKFNSDWLNDEPTEEATKLIVPLLQEGYTTITEDTGVDKEVIDLCWYKLAACAAIVRTCLKKKTLLKS